MERRNAEALTQPEASIPQPVRKRMLSFSDQAIEKALLSASPPIK